MEFPRWFCSIADCCMMYCAAGCKAHSWDMCRVGGVVHDVGSFAAMNGKPLQLGADGVTKLPSRG